MFDSLATLAAVCFGIVVVMAVAGIVFRVIVGRYKRGVATGPAKNKSKVLRNAKVMVHKVEPAEEPKIVLDKRALKQTMANSKSKHIEVEFDEEDTKPKRKKDRKYFAVELTIEPRPASGKFREWDLDDLQLIPFDFKGDKAGEAPIDICSIEKCQVLEDGEYVEPENHQFEGPRTMSMIIGVKPGNSRLKFSYMFESFGDLKLAS